MRFGRGVVLQVKPIHCWTLSVAICLVIQVAVTNSILSLLLWGYAFTIPLAVFIIGERLVKKHPISFSFLLWSFGLSCVASEPTLADLTGESSQTANSPGEIVDLLIPWTSFCIGIGLGSLLGGRGEVESDSNGTGLSSDGVLR